MGVCEALFERGFRRCGEGYSGGGAGNGGEREGKMDEQGEEGRV